MAASKKTRVFNRTDCGEPNGIACGGCDSCTGSPGRLVNVTVPERDELADRCSIHYFSTLCDCPPGT